MHTISIIECFGASGSNCSQPCNNVTYGYQCRKKCSCNHNEVCNKYVGCIQNGKLHLRLHPILLFVCFVFVWCLLNSRYVGTQEFISYVINLCQNNLQRGLTEMTLYPLNYLFILSFIIIYQNIRFLS